ncbi:MAG: enhanced serine sensitivity protein SseB C-terminal domain-containing protein [Candidatus Adiutrix sp.]|jgi:hypothetical protein|nr:enhanced serine sensitivity protein SseB C-terminal domain-containing protein [Candidatus Adiutrix sp.]
MSELHPLEEALKKAAGDPEARAAFYQALMNSEVQVVGREEEPESEGQGAHIQLKQWQQPDGSMALPFFATLGTLRKTLGEEEPALTIPVVDLFRLARSATLVFTSPEGAKSFAPEEIEALLSTTLALDPLALALVRAVRDNADESRQAFYHTLVNSQVFVLGRPKDQAVPTGAESRYMSENDQFLIHSYPHPHQEGQHIIPFFSSLEHLKRATKDNQTYMAFPALAFFSMIRSLEKPVVMNPGYEPQKLFTLDEIKYLVEAARTEPFEPRQFKPGAKISLGPPVVYPQELIGALLDFLPGHQEVTAAYLTAMRENEDNAPLILVIGFEAEGDLTDMFREAGPLIAQYAGEGQIVDFARIERDEDGLSRYFLEKVNPFYRRALNRDQAGPAAAPPQTTAPPAREDYDQPGFLGRLKRIFSGSRKNAES